MSERQRSAQEPRPAIAAPALQAILNALADGLVVVDRRGLVRFANAAAERLLGQPSGSLEGAPFEPTLLEPTLPRGRAGRPIELEVEIPGRRRPAVVERCAVAFEWEGEPAWLVSLRDVTERRRLEAERMRRIRETAARAEAEAAQHARDEYLATVAHELKTPVTRLRLAVQLALRRLERGVPPDSPQLREILEALSHDSRRLARVVRHLLDLPRLEAGTLILRPAPADLRALIERVVAEAQATTDRHTLRLRVPEEPVPALVDAEYLEEAIVSVLDNALRFSPQGGPVEVTLERVPSAPEQEAARIVVRDYGVGLPREDRVRLFERFYRGHSASHLSGLGVGLYVCRRIVELHGGSVEGFFPERGGAEIVLRLPLPARWPATASAADRKPAGWGRSTTIDGALDPARSRARGRRRAAGTDRAPGDTEARSIEGPGAARSSRSPAHQPRREASRGLERGEER